jgi:putative transposase
MTKNKDLDAAIDNLLKTYKTPKEIVGENGLLQQLTKAVLQRALQAEMALHLGHEKNSPITNKEGNARNGSSLKTIKGEFGSMPIEIPRDRDGSFEPLIIPKGQTRFPGFDDRVISLYSRGLTTREIQGHLAIPRVR